jgi:NAD(P)-dependent dehydrogenase (short-subunit alcohol dehydrogenase family)
MTDVVLGAASGMGAAVARRLAGSGRRLLLADVNIDGDADIFRCDLTSRADVDALVAAAGSIDALVVTAGLSPTMADGRRILEVNLRALAALLDAVEPVMGQGSVAVLFSSMAGHLFPDAPAIDGVLDAPLAPSFFDDLTAAGVDVDDPGTAYGLSKRGVIRLVRKRAPAWAQWGARLVSLSPGIVDTPMGRKEAAEQPVMKQMVTATSLGRMLTADEVAAVAEFLVSDAAAGITGTDVLVDGGVTAAFLG